MKTILVTGASGQLGRCFAKLSSHYPEFDFLFTSSSELDISKKCELHQLFGAKHFDYCINCAAYTNVEKAESEEEKAYQVNAEAVKNLGEVCQSFQTMLFHFSTDYVFNGKADVPYSEKDKTDPLNIYGASKLKGEENLKKVADKYFIFRTSWLYSEFGHNFFRTILKKAEERANLKITTAQVGTPTNANDLARLVMQLIASENNEVGLYHFSNEGEATWYGFAEEILKISESTEKVELEKSNDYKTVAERPSYSVLNKQKVRENLGFEVPDWKESLKGLYFSAIAAKE
ncbi:dTDP-4-dehydrorhamnose reductase [Zunongwangia sp. F363]|uniref:dTDP-4-dehydrorhamnose reductase n=1 Tax=Autumnicola tepida TaxID=3075595 RepID=A0ABU3C7J0_9FLAO|nr:dTDP-4-dehydrorhamnose reductase [Zunongwangia sp. F363]MDT0642162.1 dTDP-4-dehydrorhamnose reductase [Zunongwangia sp. F363]